MDLAADGAAIKGQKTVHDGKVRSSSGKNDDVKEVTCTRILIPASSIQFPKF